MHHLKITERKTVKKSVYQKYDGKCAYCGRNISISYFVIEHLTPHKLFIKGNDIPFAENDFINLNPSCGGCNRSKGHLFINKFRQLIEFNAKQAITIFKVKQAIDYGYLQVSELKDIEFHFEKVWRENPTMFPERKLLEKYF